LNASFAQFLADRGVVTLERARERDRETLEGYRKNLVCDRGDFDEYWALLRKASKLRDEDRRGRETARGEAVREALASLKPGEVIHVPRTKRRGLAVVLSSRDGKPTVLSEDRSFFRLSARDLDDPPVVLTRIALPRSGSARSARYRRDVASTLVSLHVKRPKPRSSRAGDPKVEKEASGLETRAREHPVHACPELAKHIRWAERADAVERQLAGVERRIRVRTETLARQFDRVLGVLHDLRYVDDWTITTKGRRLSRIYGEGDILVGEALDAGIFDDVSPSEAAALLSTVVYEARERTPLPGELPTALVADRFERLQRLWRQVRRAEDAHQVQLCRELEAGFATPLFHWAEGKPFEDLLEETEMAPGDFVRNCKQLLDLLRQVEEVAEPTTAGLMRQARERVLRGVVAYTGV
jgi:ATP-dependent RNA helicase HelY